MNERSVLIICGGPSPERGISLNSARSALDHLRGGRVGVERIVYVDEELGLFGVEPGQLYSNTPLDFDFKRHDTLEPLSYQAFAEACASVDVVFPVIHGAFGEDGQLASRLEALGCCFVGSTPANAEHAYDKALCRDALEAASLPTIPTVVITSFEPAAPRAEDRAAFENAERFIVKPARGGSSIGVRALRRSGRSVADTIADIARSLDKDSGQWLVQPFMTGTEFSVPLVEATGGPVALAPIEIERKSTTLTDEVFSFREKYMPSDHVRLHCPPRLTPEGIADMRRLADDVFKALGLRDFARIDCWRTDEGRLVISDVNPTPGIEQNSIVFIAAAEAGLSHRDLLECVANAALRRSEAGTLTQASPPEHAGRPVRVLFGGASSERQVSVLSGVNAWLKLRSGEKTQPTPYFLDTQHRVTKLSYAASLRHSVEEIEDVIASDDSARERAASVRRDVRTRLGLGSPRIDLECGSPMPLARFLDDRAPVFLGLHGGIGEDGTIQEMLEERGIDHNGPSAAACRLCIDKLATAKAVAQAGLPGVVGRTAVEVTADRLAQTTPTELWQGLLDDIGASPMVIKPASDGCSTGVAILSEPSELWAYAQAIREGTRALTGEAFSRHADEQVIAMPVGAERFMVEAFLATDSLGFDDSGTILWGQTVDTGWIEVTAGVIQVDGTLECMGPSITVANQGVLTAEEKFMGGTGVNFTPPPTPPQGKTTPEAIDRARETLARLAGALGIAGYARLDAFMHRETGEISLIEVNALPALTPSTVLFQQAVSRGERLLPHEFIQLICP
ncbi:MAG: ATP-grasp domain-containing protein [Planctomycetota bacterium]